MVVDSTSIRVGGRQAGKSSEITRWHEARGTNPALSSMTVAQAEGHALKGHPYPVSGDHTTRKHRAGYIASPITLRLYLAASDARFAEAEE